LKCNECERDYVVTDLFDSGLCDICENVEKDGNLYDANSLFEKKRLIDKWWKDAINRVYEIRLPKVPKKGDKDD